jgi:hypothetical protein
MLFKRLIGVALLQAAALLAQVDATQFPGWQAVGNVRPGDKVRVVLIRGEAIEGVFQSWSPGSVSIVSGRASMATLPAADVKEISLRRGGGRLRAAGIGGGIGFGIGFVLGAAAAGTLTDRNNPSLGARTEAGGRVGVVGAAIGAAIGALAGGARFQTIYRAR